MERKNFSSGAKWEDIVGYSRAVLVGNQLEISGTVATDESGMVGKGDFYLQTKFILQKIERVLQQAGFEMKDVVRTRMFVTDISHWQEVGKAHGEFFKDIKPATAMIQISALIDPEYLVEIEVTALRSDNDSTIDPDASGRMKMWSVKS
ncbi:MAG TPA: RidA family protein [Chryseolinea sp.]|nr:RidA family protein [Chryseolinea sp.]